MLFNFEPSQLYTLRPASEALTADFTRLRAELGSTKWLSHGRVFSRAFCDGFSGNEFIWAGAVECSLAEVLSGSIIKIYVQCCHAPFPPHTPHTPTPSQALEWSQTHSLYGSESERYLGLCFPVFPPPVLHRKK